MIALQMTVYLKLIMFQGMALLFVQIGKLFGFKDVINMTKCTCTQCPDLTHIKDL